MQDLRLLNDLKELRQLLEIVASNRVFRRHLQQADGWPVLDLDKVARDSQMEPMSRLLAEQLHERLRTLYANFQYWANVLRESNTWAADFLQDNNIGAQQLKVGSHDPRPMVYINASNFRIMLGQMNAPE